jgi:hypothetical protein
MKGYEHDLRNIEILLGPGHFALETQAHASRIVGFFGKQEK